MITYESLKELKAYTEKLCEIVKEKQKSKIIGEKLTKKGTVTPNAATFIAELKKAEAKVKDEDLTKAVKDYFDYMPEEMERMLPCIYDGDRYILGPELLEKLDPNSPNRLPIPNEKSDDILMVFQKDSVRVTDMSNGGKSVEVICRNNEIDVLNAFRGPDIPTDKTSFKEALHQLRGVGAGIYIRRQNGNTTYEARNIVIDEETHEEKEKIITKPTLNELIDTILEQSIKHIDKVQHKYDKQSYYDYD